MLAGGREGAGIVRRGPERMAGLEQEPWVAALLGQGQEVLAELQGLLVLGTPIGIPPEAREHREELGCVSHLLAQRPSPRIGAFHLRVSKPLGDHQRRAQGRLHGEFLLGALRGVRQLRQQRNPQGKVGDRLLMGTALESILAGILEILHRPDAL
jgi:hypothetical protein